MVKSWTILQTIEESLAGRTESGESCQGWELGNEMEKGQMIEMGRRWAELDEELSLVRSLLVVSL